MQRVRYESCSDHDPEPADFRWAQELEPEQTTGLFWCSNGKHYAWVTKQMLWTALMVLAQLDTAVPA